MKEVYGGEGKVKVKKKNKNRVFSFKYTGPERAAKLLEGENDRFFLNLSEYSGRAQRLLYMLAILSGT